MSRSAALQKQFKKSVSKARSRGIDSRPRYQNIDKRVKEQTKGIKDILNRPKDDFGGGRDNYIAAQSGINSLSNLLKEQQENTLRNSIASSFGKGVVDKSDFLGHAGDKMFLGMNYGSTPTVAASTINPFSAETIETIKAREGLTTPQYNEFLDSLGEINPDLAYETFMPEGAKLMNKAAEIMAPFPLKALASTMKGGKNVFDFFSDKGSRVGQDLSDQLKRYQEGIISLNPFKEKTQTAPSEEFISRMNPDVAPQGEDFMMSNTSTENFNPELLFRVPGASGYMVQKNPNIGPTSAFSSDVNKFVDLPNYPGTFVKFNEGGLASLNNPNYRMLMSASNFGF